MSRIAFVTLALGVAAALPSAAQQAQAPAAPSRAPRTARASQAATPITIPYQRFVLKNGLTLLVHEDHKAPDRKSVV